MQKNIQFQGLSAAEVEKHRQRYGSNILTPPTRTPWWRELLLKFTDPLIIILMIAGLLSTLISFYEYYGLGEAATVFFEPVGIFIAIILATGLAFYFEKKADKEFALLNKVNDDEPVQVYRDGNAVLVPKKDIVVGDIVILSAGNEIPADGKLLTAVNLNVDESSLTGEPVCRKTADPAQFDSEATYPSDHVLRGTKVMEGHGIMEVSAVGDGTENGKVLGASRIDNSVKTPLNEQLDRLGILITRMSYIVASLVVIGRVTVYFIDMPFDWISFVTYLLQTVMIAVTLVVVSVPEGLPMAVALSLAYSMRRMLKTNNLVRRMHACETMGATTVICTDKTGTLTQNQMRVYEAVFYGDISDDTIVEGIAVNSTAEIDFSGQRPQVIGNPTEGALLLWLHDKGRDYKSLRAGVELVEELPFSTERKYMASVVRRADGTEILYVKGAPEIVYNLCGKSSVRREDVDKVLASYQEMAMRTLGFACCRIEPGEKVIADGKVHAPSLEFEGITAISDPVRPDVPDAVREVVNAGIAVKIVTGDTVGTAKEIARQIGLWDDNTDSDRNIITGTEFGELSDDELTSRIKDFKIIARARPLDKRRLVEALQRCNEVVAVTGDGTNDAPALKAAHVGLSMGDGTSVAKEASDITIIDNSFASIGRAVMWGRSLYKNIQRFILFQLTVNVVACLIVLCGAFMNTQPPLTVTQMLWVNLIMDTFAAMALASLPPDRSVMKAKPRGRKDFIISKAMAYNIFFVGGIFFAILLSLLVYLEHTNLTSLTGLGHLPWKGFVGLSTYELSLFFSFFVFLQFWNMFNARAFGTGRSAFHLHDCSGFLFIAAAIFIGQIAIVELGGPFFGVTPLSFSDWVLIILSTSLVLVAGEIIRLFKAKKN